MRTINKIQQLERLSAKLKSVELTSFKDSKGTYKIKYKDTILFNGIPEQTLEDYILRETTTCFEKIGKHIDEYVKMTVQAAEQLELQFFKDEKISG
jgi:hypothetical protein